MVEALVKAGARSQAIHAADRDHAGINRCIGQTGDPHTKVIMEFVSDPSKAGKLACGGSRP
jgi:hypothetical protein